MSKNHGLNSGFIIAQYTTTALVSKNYILASPASINMISVSAGKEDHVSMGMAAAIMPVRLWSIWKRYWPPIEMLCGCQAVDFSNAGPGSGSPVVYKVIRKYVNLLDEGIPLYNDTHKVSSLIRNRGIIRAMEDRIGELPV